MEAAFLKVSGLSVGFDQEDGWVSAVSAVDFEIRPGETFALVGESGSGKSVTALSVLRLLPAAGRIVSGEILLGQESLLSLPETGMQRFRGGRIGVIFQDPSSALNPVLTAGQQIDEVLRLHTPLSRPARRSRCIELLEQVGLPQPTQQLDAYPHQLSGGQRQRVMIAIALAGEPELLIADEPTTALDVTIQAQILDLLKRLQRDTGMALWLITHDLGIVHEMADRIAVMRKGVIIEQATHAEFFAAPSHAYSRALLDAMPRLGRCLARPLWQPELSRSEPLLTVRDFSVRYVRRTGFLQRKLAYTAAVDGVDFTLGQGETLALVGESGCGKTSLGKALLRLIPASSGCVNWLSDFADCRLAGFAQIVFQDPYAAMNPRMLVGDVIEEGLRSLRPAMCAAERRTKVEALLLAVGLEASASQRYPHEFSGGQRQRICIARALAVEPALIVLDEPTSALDVSVQAQILALLRELKERQGLSYLFITHDLGVVAEVADRVAVMHRGKIVEIGPVDQVLLQPKAAYTQQLLAALPALRRS